MNGDMNGCVDEGMNGCMDDGMNGCINGVCDVSLTDVYDNAAQIGTDIEKIVNLHGTDIVECKCILRLNHCKSELYK